MGIYDTLPIPEINLDSAPKIGMVIGGILIIALVVFVLWNQAQTGFGIFGFLEPNALSASLSGPIDLKLNANGYPNRPNTELVVTLTNPTSEAISNASVHVTPQDPMSLTVFPSNKVIDRLDKSRTIRFSIRANPVQRILPGTYLIDIKAYVGTKEYTQQVELEVKTNEP